MLHELRIYHCIPGRQPDLPARFQSHTLGLWKKHGIRQIGFWTVLVGESNNDVYYMLEWDSMAQREAIWNTFMTDPEWMAIKTQTEANGPLLTHITNYFMQPTAYSKLQ